MHFSTIFVPGSMLIGTVAAGINSVSWTGSGCPPNSVGGLLTSDGLNRTMIFTSYIASDSSPDKGCQVTISFTVPTGWASTTLKADYRGFTRLESGGILTLTSPGGGVVINGPYDDNFIRTESTLVSGAGGTTQTVVVNTAIALGGTVASTNTGYLDTIDLAFLKRT